MSFRRNVERERLIYRYWRLGHTIDEISRLTGIPRSSVGYYVRKFNKKYGRSRGHRVEEATPALGEDRGVKRDEGALAFSGLIKSISLVEIFQTVIKLAGQGKLEDAYYYLSILKLFTEIEKAFALTPEEQEAAEKALMQYLRSIGSHVKAGEEKTEGSQAVREYILEEGEFKELRRRRHKA